MLRFVTASLGACLLVSPLFGAEYKGPYVLKTGQSGARIYVLDLDSSELQVLTPSDDKILRSFKVAKQPNGFVLGLDEKVAYVTCGGYRGMLQVLDLTTGQILKSVPTGHTPYGPSIAPDGKTLYVCNRFAGDVWEYTLPDLVVKRKFKVIREPRRSLVSPDGKSLFVTNFLPNDPNNVPEDPMANIDVACEVNVIDLVSGETKNIRLPNGSHSLHGLAFSPDGKYAFVTQILARYPLPPSQLERGWVNTNAVGIIDIAKKELFNTVLLDEVDYGAANPWGVAVTPDSRKLLVALAGTHELCVVELEPLLKKLTALAEFAKASPGGTPPADAAYHFGSSKKPDDVPNDLAFLVGLKKRIKLPGFGPRELTVVGNNVYVGMYFSDTVVKVELDTPGRPKVTEIPLGPKPALSAARRGELHWNDATTCFQAWLSCASCHPDARMDALNWDLLNDGMGNPKNAKSMIYARKTSPAMWHGIRKTGELAIRTGYKYILFVNPSEERCTDIEAYFDTLTPLESPYLVDGQLSEKAKRGKKVFEDSRIGCFQCHPESNYFTDQKTHDVNSKVHFDRRADFDTPGLNEVWRTAPYMHDGRYPDMKDVFTKARHGDVLWTREPTEQEIDDLVEYVLSL